MSTSFVSGGLVAALVLVACGAPLPLAVPADIDPSDLGGFGDPVRGPGEFPETRGAPFSGTVRLRDNGCWMIEINGEPRLVAFPEGFSGAGDDATRIVGPDGMEVVDGTVVDAVGEVTAVENIPGGRDSRYGNLVAFCQPDGGEIAVLDRVDPAFDPVAVNSEQWAQLLGDATFTRGWPCGLAFAVSSADQRIGLVLSTFPPTASGVVDLPNPSWTAEVIVGKHLFAQNCDDAVEQWESSPVIVGRWPLTSGRFDLLLPESGVGECGDASTVVESQLKGAIVSTPSGDVELPDIPLVNYAWGCFAG